MRTARARAWQKTFAKSYTVNYIETGIQKIKSDKNTVFYKLFFWCQSVARVPCIFPLAGGGFFDCLQNFGVACRQRPYFVEYTRSHPNSEVKRRKARSVLGWGTAWEALWVLLASFCVFRTQESSSCRA